MTNSNGRAPFAPYTTPQGTTVLIEANRAVSYSTADGIDYTPAELDDLTSRKVEAVPFSGDDLARIVRAQRGTARATGQPDPYATHLTGAVRSLWGSYRSVWLGENTPRRMAAVGTLTLDGDAEALCNMRGEDPNDDEAWNTARADIMAGAVAFDH